MDNAPSPFRSWNGVEAWQFADGVRLHAIGGEQILLCRVTYEPGEQVPGHAHQHTQQGMAILGGEATRTVAGETPGVKAGGRPRGKPPRRAPPSSPQGPT